jgi:hypothetical protein
MDITKRIDELQKKNGHIQSLQEELSVVHKKASELAQKEKEVTQLQNDIE